MKTSGKGRIASRGGTSLVELVVAMLLLGIIMGMVVGILSPAAKLFLRMEKLQRAQAILDNTILELYGIAEEATQYVKIYQEGMEDVSGAVGAGEGSTLEFVSPEGYVTLVSAGGCAQTRILVGAEGTQIEEVEPIEAGRLLMRYYVNDAVDSSSFQYRYRDGEGLIARAVQGVFTDGYYMGNYLEIRFYHPSGSADGSPVDSLRADVSLYDMEEDGTKGELVVQEKDIVLDFRYKVVRSDKVTAREVP